MRGRTNAHSGIVLNATTSNKVVKNTPITAGDFVEYYTESALVDLNYRVIGGTKVGNYIVLLLTTGLALLKFQDGKATFVSSYSTNTFTHICEYDGKLYGVKSSSGSYIYKMEIANDLIVDNGYITLSSSIGQSVYLTNVDGYLVAFSGSKYAVIEDDVVKKLDSISLGATINDVEIIDDVTYILSNGESRFATLHVSSDFTLTATRIAYVSGTEILGIFDDRYAIIRQNTNVNVYTVDIVAGTYGSTSNSFWSQYYTYNFINLGGGYIAGVSSGHTVLGEYTQGEIVEASHDNVTAFGFYLYDNDKIVATSLSSEKQIKTLIVDRTLKKLTEYQSTNYVIPWAGSGNPIGVAKNSGSAGDTIGVYIPSSSY